MNESSPKSLQRDLAERALAVMPGGVSHDGRQMEPHGLFIQSAEGARKFDPDGRSYIDFACGNGAIMLGHGHKASIDAVAKAASRGFHFSAGSEIELRWAELVKSLMPAAEQVRFTSSGNEACLLALAVARATTKKSKILTLSQHYSGWAIPAVLPRLRPEDKGDSENLAIVEVDDVAQALSALASGSFAGIIVEPTGASFGKIPLDRAAARAIASESRAAGSVCIFDETITGFRVSPGGAQRVYGIAPDLIVLGKILGGGLPCGALAGRRELLQVLDNRSTRISDADYVCHMGTGNGNPVVASLGVETLSALADGQAIARADSAAARLRLGLNTLFGKMEIGWAAYGESSGFHIFTNPHGRALDPRNFDAAGLSFAELGARNNQLINDLRLVLLEEGIDINPWPGGLVSAAHDSDIVDELSLIHI